MFFMDCFVSLDRLPRNDEINKSLRDLALSNRSNPLILKSLESFVRFIESTESLLYFCVICNLYFLWIAQVDSQ